MLWQRPRKSRMSFLSFLSLLFLLPWIMLTADHNVVVYAQLVPPTLTQDDRISLPECPWGTQTVCLTSRSSMEQPTILSILWYDDVLISPSVSFLESSRHCRHFVVMSENVQGGAIPSQLSAWQSLRWFMVNNSQLSGTIPPSLSSWGNLEWFDASSTQLSGTIPREISSWSSSLALFDVSSTQLSGTIPEELSLWKGIQMFDISFTQITGTIPSSFSAWSLIRFFYIYSTPISGSIPSSLSWSYLENLSTEKTLLSGVLDGKAMSSWTSLQWWYMSETSMEGTIPSLLGALTALKLFHMQNSRISGTIPPSIATWTSLQTFFVQYTDVSGTIPPELSAWTSIQMFSIAHTKISGTLPDSLTAWTSLNAFDASYTALSGTLTVQPITCLHNTFFLTATRNLYVTFSCPTTTSFLCEECIGWDAVPNVDTVDVSRQQMLAFPSSIPPNVRSLTMDDVRFRNRVTNDVVQTFLQSRVDKPLVFLSMQRCGIGGTLPSFVLCLARTLNLRGNLFSGSLPVGGSSSSAAAAASAGGGGGGGCAHLVSLDISFNRLSGPIPESWPLWFTNLETMHMTGNTLTSFPTHSSFPSLRVLRINNNNITLNMNTDFAGILPSRLEVLDISNNTKVRGEFPFTLANHTSLRELYLSHTGVTTLPQILSRKIEILDMEQTPWRSRPSWMNDPLPERVLYVNVEPDLIEYVQAYTRANETKTVFTTSYASLIAPLQVMKNTSQILVSRLLVQNVVKATKERDLVYGKTMCADISVLQERDLYNDICIVERKGCESMENGETSWPHCNIFRMECPSLCRTPHLLYTQQPQVVSLLDVRNPIVQFNIPSDSYTRICGCPSYMDFLDSARVDYTYVISEVMMGEGGMTFIRKVYPVQKLPVLLDGNLVLSMSDFPFVYGKFYQVSISVMMEGVSTKPVASNVFQVEGCPDTSGKQAAVLNTAFCAPCPEYGICNGTTVVLASDNTYRPSTEYALFILCDESTLACTVDKQNFRLGYECAQGYQGFMCSVCSEGYGKFGSACLACSEPPVQRLVVSFSVFAVYVFYVIMCYTAAVSDDDVPLETDGVAVVIESPTAQNQPKDDADLDGGKENTTSAEIIERCFDTNKATSPTPPPEPPQPPLLEIDNTIGSEQQQSPTSTLKRRTRARRMIRHIRKNMILPVLRFSKIVLTWLFCMGVLFLSKPASMLFLSVRSLLVYIEQLATASPFSTNAFSCLVQHPVYTTFVLYTAGSVPITIACTATLYLLTSSPFLPSRKGHTKKAWPMSAYSSVVCCLSLMYPEIIVSVIQLLQCDTYDIPKWSESSVSPVTTRFSLLNNDRRISCDNDEGYKPYRTGAIVVGVVYGLGFPLTCVILHRYVPHCVFNFLSEDVLPPAWWWELFVMTRKGLLLLCITVVPIDDLQLISYIAVLLMVCCVFLKWTPYEERIYNGMELLSILSCGMVATLLGFLEHYHDDMMMREGIGGTIVAVVCVVVFVYFLQTLSIGYVGWKTWHSSSE